MELKTVNLFEMTWLEIKAALENGYHRVIIPTASIEQHGYHLPENTDTVLGESLSVMIAKRLGETLVAPSIRPGMSSHHMNMPGTLTLREETFRMLIEDYITCYMKHGFNEIILLSSHGGNVKYCAAVAEEMSQRYPLVRIISVADIPTPEELRELECINNLPVGTNGGHADERETSEMLSIVPELVHMEKAQPGYCEPLDAALLQRFFKEGVTALSEVGCIGDPCPASVERGVWYREVATEQLCSQINKLLEI